MCALPPTTPPHLSSCSSLRVLQPLQVRGHTSYSGCVDTSLRAVRGKEGYVLRGHAMLCCRLSCWASQLISQWRN
eukprot:1156945-Pelagomonas_calceolata.AAC.6